MRERKESQHYMVFHLATDDTTVYGEHHGGPVGQDHRVVVGQPVRLSLTVSRGQLRNLNKERRFVFHKNCQCNFSDS